MSRLRHRKPRGCVLELAATLVALALLWKVMT